MELKDKTVLILGGAGLVGRAVTRGILPHRPRRIVLSSLRQREAEDAVADLAPVAGNTELEAAWGDLFVPDTMRDETRSDVLGDANRRQALVDDVYGELTDDVFRRSSLGALLTRVQPDAVVDCINTAGALAYQNAFQSASELRSAARAGTVDLEAVERHLATMYLPQLIRHVQIALEGMRRAGTGIYVKIGTAGTGGMGLNIPFTHSEERPSRVLLSKAGLAGAHTLLLYLMARTPGAPAVKEIKPTAAISWKSIGYGPIHRGGRDFSRADCTEPVPAVEAFRNGARTWVDVDTPLEGVYLDAGENGLFSLGEFEVLTALGLMEFVTPEEIAANVIREIQAHPTGTDVVSALDGATMGPTYRAGVMRSAAIDRMEELEREHGVRAVAYEMLGPPRVSKLLFEAALLGRLYGDLETASSLDAEATATEARSLLESDADLRQRILSIGLPILLDDGTVLRGPMVKVPLDGEVERSAGRGWVDTRAENWTRWRTRIGRVLAERETLPGVDQGSVADFDRFERTERIRPGALAAWILRTEERGARMKR